MRIDVRDNERQFLGRVTVNIAEQPERAPLTDGVDGDVKLDWSETMDADGMLKRCPVCGCRDIFSRRDFPQRFGMVVVVIAAVTSVVMFAMGLVLWAIGVLAAVVVLDFVVIMFVRRCLVCYRCRSEFRDVMIDKRHHSYELAIGEKYRPVDAATSAQATKPVATSSHESHP